jgi:hypothetical protein
MDAAMEVARLVLRQESTPPAETPDEAIQCEGQNSYDGRMGVRISAIFVILVGSLFGKFQHRFHLHIRIHCVLTVHRCRFPHFCKAKSV